MSGTGVQAAIKDLVVYRKDPTAKTRRVGCAARRHVITDGRHVLYDGAVILSVVWATPNAARFQRSPVSRDAYFATDSRNPHDVQRNVVTSSTRRPLKLNPTQMLRTGSPSIHLLCIRFACPFV